MSVSRQVLDQIDDLVQEVFAVQPQPYPPNIIEEVFVAIENHDRWLKRYQTLHAEYEQINQRIGWKVKQLAGMETVHETPAKKTKLIKDYTVLK